MTPFSTTPVVSRQPDGVGVAIGVVGVGETGSGVSVGVITGVAEAGTGVFGGKTGCGEAHPGRSRPKGRNKPIKQRKILGLKEIRILSI